MREAATLKIKDMSAMSPRELSDLADWLMDMARKALDADYQHDDDFVARFYVEEQKRAA